MQLVRVPARGETVELDGVRVHVIAGDDTQIWPLVPSPAIAAGMAEYLIRQIRHTDNVDVALEHTVTAVHGPDQLEALDVSDARPGVARRVETSALCLLIGADPDTGCLDGAPARDGAGYLLTGAQLAAPGRRPTWPLERAPSMLETSIPGDFAVGAVRHRSVKPVASVVGEGASAIQSVHKYLGDGDARAPS